MRFTLFLIPSTLILVASTQSTTTDVVVPSSTPVTTLPAEADIVILTPVTTFAVTSSASAHANDPVPIPFALQTYMASVTAQPEYTSAVRALTSAMPASVNSQIKYHPIDYFNSLRLAGKTPIWASAVPASYMNYLASIGAVEASIMSRASPAQAPTDFDWLPGDPAPTHGPQVKVVGAALAVGAAGLAML